MSNFIFSECGMTNIDCGHDGYKTPKEIELEKKVHILNKANMKLENELGHFADLSKTIDQFADLGKKVERLQKQLRIATKALKDVAYLYIYTDKDLSTVANNALKEIEEVK